jgi:hypothetical protein
VDDRLWKNVSIVLGVACALLIGVAGALVVVGHKSGGSVSPTDAPSASQVASVPAPTAAPSGSGSVKITPTPGPTATPGPISQATITFNSLGLDSSTDANGAARIFQFKSDGAGSVTFAITKMSAGGTARLCIKVDTGAFTCQVGTTGKMPNFPKGKSDPGHNTWTVSVVGYGSSKPTVDVTFSWPTATPQVTFSHGRFQGSATSGISESLNGFTATFKPRNSGSVNVQAQWSVVTADAQMTLLDDSTPPPVTVDQRVYKAITFISPDFTAKVDPTKTYMIKLRNSSPDEGQHPDLTAQISFP